MRLLAGVTVGLCAALATPGCVTIATGAEPAAPERTPAAPLERDFQIWDMHAKGNNPSASVKVIDETLAARGYWLTSAFLGMPRLESNARIGAGVTLAKADLREREQMLDQKLRTSGISGTSAMVMLDAEAFRPYEGPKALAWYNQTAQVASRHFERWFWYFQPYRYESASAYFESEQDFYDWYARQEFIQLADAISVTVYHGRDQDADTPQTASSRMQNDRHLKRAIEFARRVGKPLIVTVRADMAGRPREQIMTRRALEASWRALFLREGVDGIAIWNDQPDDAVDFDRRWAQTRIEPAIRRLLEERADWLARNP